MNLIKNLSIRTMAERYGLCFKRFPLSMILIIFLTCLIIYSNHGWNPQEKLEFFLIFYPATGALLAIALSLLTEDFKSKVVAVITQVLVHLIWFGVSAYLSQFDRFSLPQLIAVSATVVAIGLSVFIVCFYRRNQEVPFWNFSMRMVLALAITVTIGAFLTLGLLLLVESLKMLFSLQMYSEIYVDIWTVCMVLLAPSMFMILIPRGKSKYLATVADFSRFAKGVVQYLFLPLLGLYLITLYAYASKILFQWSLPVGNVSYLVSGSMVFMVLLIYLTFPLQYLEGNKLFKRIIRWLPVLMLPLLALMTVAIGRRLADYGITVSRLYLLVFNIWCYAVCLWLIFTRNKRIWLIPASFAVILFLISVGPQSIANVTQRQLKNEARTAFVAAGFNQFPLTGENYELWLKQADSKVARSIDSKLHYLYTDYGYRAINDLVGKDVITGRCSSLDADGNITEDLHDTFANDGLIKNSPVPQGYSSMTLVTGADDNIVKVDGDIMLVKVNDGNGVEHRFEFNVKQLAEYDTDRIPDDESRPLFIDNGEALLAIDDFRVTVYSRGSNYVSFSGILFTK